MWSGTVTQHLMDNRPGERMSKSLQKPPEATNEEWLGVRPAVSANTTETATTSVHEIAAAFCPTWDKED